MKKPKPRKQAEVTAATLKRLATAARKCKSQMSRNNWDAWADALDAEAARIRRKP